MARNLSDLTKRDADKLQEVDVSTVTPTDGQVLAYNLANTEYEPVAQSGGSGGSEDYILLQHQETSGTDGGTATSGSWETGTLNTEVADTGNNCTLSSNAFTLSAGTYRIYATSPFLATNSSKMKLRNTSDSTDVLIGTNDHADSGGSDNGVSIVAGQFTISSSKTFEMQRRVQTTKAANGYGVTAGFSVTEVYLQVELWKEGTGGAGGTGGDEVLEHIATGSENSITMDVSSFGADIDDLEFSIYGAIDAATTSDEIYVRFNSDTGANYDTAHSHVNALDAVSGDTLDGPGTTYIRAMSLPGTLAQTNAATDISGKIPQFRNATKFKKLTGMGGILPSSTPTTSNIFTAWFSGQWRSQSAITSITFLTDGGNNFTDDTVIKIYGKNKNGSSGGSGSGGALPYIQLRHTETSSTDGGGSLLGAWRTLPFDD